MRELRAVSDVSEMDAPAGTHRDLEAETAHRINQLVARTRTWRNGSLRSNDNATVEVAAS